MYDGVAEEWSPVVQTPIEASVEKSLPPAVQDVMQPARERPVCVVRGAVFIEDFIEGECACRFMLFAFVPCELRIVRKCLCYWASIARNICSKTIAILRGRALRTICFCDNSLIVPCDTH